ncbi:MAG TPA: Gfo/Idh/MocA family oxidoreductase [Jiangellales bacterium]|nr:Gfo/Idh/MocA family oxidoreductase [Jiangellales bacterium]
MPLQWGVVATGSISITFAEELQRARGSELAAVASRSAERAAEFAGRHGARRAYGSVEELVADDDVHAVYVGSTHQHHAQATKLALEAGKAVLCEKPFTINAVEAESVIALARYRGVFLMEAMWMRCLPAVQRLLATVADGAIGPVRHVAASLGNVPATGRTYRMNDPALGGGALLDMGVYPLTFATLVLGQPDEVAATAVVQDGVDHAMSVAMSWRGRDGSAPATASVATSMVATLTGDAVVIGEEARIHVPTPFHHPAGFAIVRPGEDPEWVEAPYRGKGYVHEIEEVERCVAAGLTESPLVPLDDTLAVMSLLDTIRDAVGLTYPTES